MARKRVAKKGKITAWSFSRFYSYRQCPKKLSFQVHDRLKEPPNKAMERGIDIHKKCERYILKEVNRMPPELKHFKDDFKDLRARKDVKAEDQWCFDNKWNEVDWFSQEAHLRIKVDAHHGIIKELEHPDAWEVYLSLADGNEEMLDGSTHRVIDFKTGKVNPALGQEQTSLYALGAFNMFKDVDAIITELWYLDDGQISESLFLRSDLKGLEQHWKLATKKMLNDTRFDPTPGGACKWCAFSKAKGGPCTAA